MSKRLMRDVMALVVVLFMAATANAQQYMRIWRGGDYTQVWLSEAGDMAVSGGASVAIANKVYDVAAIDSITFGARVHVRYDGNRASVEGTEWTTGVTAQVSGANVTITNTNVSEELEFALSGTSLSGSFTYNGNYKTTLRLEGLNLKSTTQAAINIQCGKRIAMKLVGDNMLEDAVGGVQKAALYCKGHLEISGTGTLTVKGNAAHAIATKEYLEIKRSVGKIAVTGSVKDGLHVGQYLLMNGGVLEVSGNRGDAIQVEYVTLADGVTPDETKEMNGRCMINDGTIVASATQDDTHVLKVDGDITISGGTLRLTATGAGSRCIDANANLTVQGGELTLAASGAKYDDGTGDTSRSRLGKIDGDFTLSAGKIACTITKPAKGFKVDGTFTMLGGTLSGTKDGATATPADLMEAATVIRQ